MIRTVVGRRLRMRRHRQGLTLRQVAQRAHVALGYVSEVERGMKESSSETLAALCAALNVPVSVLLAEASIDMAALEAAQACGTKVATQRQFIRAA